MLLAMDFVLFMICLSSSLSLQVKTLKEKIENEKGKDGFPVAGQKLIYAGTVSVLYSPALSFVWHFDEDG